MQRVLGSSIPGYSSQEVCISGWVDSVRELGSLTFIILRDRSASTQVVLEGKHDLPSSQSVISVRGTVRPEPRAPGGFEVLAQEVTEVSHAHSPLPIDMNGKRQNVSLDAQLEHRVLSLRSPRALAPIRIQSEFVRTFREFFIGNGFTEIFTPKIVGTGTEGGAELFEVKYFEKKAYLAQSPQLYKQMMVGTGLERVIEIGPAFRAEEHNTSRHINQFLSLDIEMGFIQDVEDVMSLEERFLGYALEQISCACAKELEICGAQAPRVVPVPRLDIEEARSVAESKAGRRMPPGNLDPEGERVVSQVVLEDTGSEFVFITGYPVDIRPFYAMPDLNRPGKTSSFDLLFRGLEVTTGGQRMHDYDMLVRSMQSRGLDPGKFSGYLEAFKYGMPPHGGLAIGAERFVARLLGLANIREATAFPRDRTRLQP